MMRAYLLSCDQELYLLQDAQYFWALTGRLAELLRRFFWKYSKAAGHFRVALVNPGGGRASHIVIFNHS